MKGKEKFKASDIAKMYKIEVSRLSEDDGGGFVACIPKLGIIGDGETPGEAMNDVLEVAEDVVNIMIEDGEKIPVGDYYEESNFSGKLLVRLPKKTHELLSKKSEIEGTSINQLVNGYVNMGLGLSEASDKADSIIQELKEFKYELFEKVKNMTRRIENLESNKSEVSAGIDYNKSKDIFQPENKMVARVDNLVKADQYMQRMKIN